jgi:branched-chain amino acid transport system substrate-binding protein
MKRSLFLFVVLVMFVAASVVFAAPPTDPLGVVTIKPGEPIHIVYWLVTAGPDSTLGIDARRGAEIAIDDIKGTLLGHKIKFDGQDTGCNAEGGQAAATKLASDPTIVAAIGSNCSSEAKPGAPILWNVGISTVSPSNTAPYLTDPKRGPSYDGYLRTAHNDKVQGAVAAQFALKKLNVKKAATIHDGSVYAEQLANVFAETFKKNGGTIVAQEAVAPTDTDMKPVLTKLATAKPEFIYYPIFVAAAGHVTRQVKEVSGLEKVALMSADGAYSVDFYKAAGESAVGMYHSSPDYEAFGKVYEDFIKKHEKKYNEKTLSTFHAHAYDAANMIFKAIEKVAVKEKDGTLYIGRKALRDALYATKNMKGITGNITCNEYGDCADPKIAIYKTNLEDVKSLVMPKKSFWKP